MNIINDPLKGATYSEFVPPKTLILPPGFMLKMDRYPGDTWTVAPSGQAIWNGEGLPPVGAICEMQDGMGVWTQVEIFADHKHYVHGWDDDKRISYFSNLPAEFRPLRTAEQIAAEERLHQVRNALSAIHAGQLFPNDFVRGNIVAATVEAMIDAGYRKQEQSK